MIVLRYHEIFFSGWQHRLTARLLVLSAWEKSHHIIILLFWICNIVKGQAKYHNPDSNQGLEIIGTFSGPSHPDIQGLAVQMWYTNIIKTNSFIRPDQVVLKNYYIRVGGNCLLMLKNFVNTQIILWFEIIHCCKEFVLSLTFIYQN